jgi:hypothetical protein
MKSLTLVVTCIFFISTIGCVEPEEVILVRSCGGFDFTVPPVPIQPLSGLGITLGTFFP